MRRPRGRPPKNPQGLPPPPESTLPAAEPKADLLRKLDDHVAANRGDEDGSKLLRPSEIKKIRDVPHGVSITWLSTVFRIDRLTAQKRLLHCPILRVAGDDRTKLYDVATAASYLVTPNMSSEEFLRVLTRNDLPSSLQVQFWDAMLKRQTWEERAGQLWPTGRVMDVLGATFQTMKFTMQLWVETLEREAEVTPAQREAITRMVDALQQEIYAGLVERATEGQSGPLAADLPALLGDRPAGPQLQAQGAPDGDDGSDLI